MSVSGATRRTTHCLPDLSDSKSERVKPWRRSLSGHWPTGHVGKCFDKPSGSRQRWRLACGYASLAPAGERQGYGRRCRHSRWLLRTPPRRRRQGVDGSVGAGHDEGGADTRHVATVAAAWVSAGRDCHWLLRGRACSDSGDERQPGRDRCSNWGRGCDDETCRASAVSGIHWKGGRRKACAR